MIDRFLRLAAALPILSPMILTAASMPAWADDFAAEVAKLGADRFAAKEQAVIALGKLGDLRAVPVLKALDDDRLFQTTEGRVVVSTVIGGTTKLADAATGEAVSGVDPDGLERIHINNRMRGEIEAVLGDLTMFSTDRAARLAAARDALKHPSAATAALLVKAIAAEKDPDVRSAMQRSLLAARLFSGTKKEQLDAVRAALPPIRRSRAGSTKSATLPAPIRTSGRPLRPRSPRSRTVCGLSDSLPTCSRGISLGSVLLLAAIGLAITFGVMGVINMAHGEMIMLGAYCAYVCQELFRAFLPPDWLDVYLAISVPVAFVFTAIVGIALERTVIRFLYGRPLETLLATWGVSLILQQTVRSIFGAPNKAVSNPSWMTGGFDLVGGFTVTWNRLCIIAFCFIVLGALALLLNHTRFGLYMRAVTQNRDMAAVMGIRTARIDALTFGLGSGIAGMAGVALSQIGNVNPNLGTIYIVDSFLVVVFGGVGNLMGTLVGALTLGIVNNSSSLSPAPCLARS
jgi:urea transport system permease protein